MVAEGGVQDLGTLILDLDDHIARFREEGAVETAQLLGMVRLHLKTIHHAISNEELDILLYVACACCQRR
jgi:hypothetical protein